MPALQEATETRIPTLRLTPTNDQVLANLGLLKDLAGTWEGEGFNLIARPDFEGKANLYLQLNPTRESLKIDPIGSSIPNRGFGQNDIELFGLTYLQKINDSATGGAMHIEPGLWVTQPSTTFPTENPPTNGQIIARMGSIPHGNAMLAAGTAERFTGAPTLTVPGAQYAFSKFPSFNSTPFAAADPGQPPTINAAGTSEKLNAAANGVPPFTQYDVTIPDSATNPRTPFGTTDPPITAATTIQGIPVQDVINDPIVLLQAAIQKQVAKGCTFEGTVLNIATQAQIQFFTTKNAPRTGPFTTVNLTDAAGGIENIPFLLGQKVGTNQEANAQTAQVYATFWIETVTHPNGHKFTQLQYAQMVILNFPILAALPTVVNLGWPHISVATLRKSFG